jgi:steroid delta-isomerase-like uncharacterized protein
MDHNWPQQYIEAWNSHNADRVLSFMAPEALYVDTTLGERLNGHDAIRHFIDSMAETLSTDYRFELTNAFFTDTDYAAEWDMLGTHDRSDGRLPVTGKQFRIHGVSIGKLRGGKIAENRDYWNMVDFLTQIGIMPADQSAPAPA